MGGGWGAARKLVALPASCSDCDLATAFPPRLSWLWKARLRCVFIAEPRVPHEGLHMSGTLRAVVQWAVTGSLGPGSTPRTSRRCANLTPRLKSSRDHIWRPVSFPRMAWSFARDTEQEGVRAESRNTFAGSSHSSARASVPEARFASLVGNSAGPCALGLLLRRSGWPRPGDGGSRVCRGCRPGLA